MEIQGPVGATNCTKATLHPHCFYLFLNLPIWANFVDPTDLSLYLDQPTLFYSLTLNLYQLNRLGTKLDKQRGLRMVEAQPVKNTDLGELFAHGLCHGIWLFNKLKHKSEIVVWNLKSFRKVKDRHIKICKSPIKFKSLIVLLYEWELERYQEKVLINVF